MYDLYFMTTPNVYKVMIAFEEIGADYRFKPIDVSTLQQMDSAKVGGSITGKVPVVVDNEPKISTKPLTIAESGAILFYLAEKYERLLPGDPVKRLQAMQWLIWQVSGLAPFGGQYFHFQIFGPTIAPDVDHSYGQKRYKKILEQHYNVLETRLEGRNYLVDEYSIADITCYPWIRFFEPHFMDLDSRRARFPRIEAWRDRIAERSAVVAAYEKAKEVNISNRERNEQDIVLFSKDELRKVIVY